MIRKAYVFQLKPECEEEYERRHNPIWPELEELIKSSGVHNYSIFHHPKTDQLFSYFEIEDETRWSNVGKSAIARRWGIYMSEVMEIKPNGEPVDQALSEVFHLP